MIDVLLAVSLIALVLLLAGFVLRPSTPRVVGITVRAGRQITVNGRPYPEVLDENSAQSFEVPFKQLIAPGNKIELTIVTAPGGSDTPVSLQLRGTKTLNIDASHETQTIVYAGHEIRSRSAAVVGKCIWCKNGVIVCGLMPSCPQ